jgi:hypothetical protein
MMAPRYFVLRLRRDGPLLPGRLIEIDHEPGVRDNPRDRWPPTVMCGDIAGNVVPPEEITSRAHWPAGHWKYAQPITEAEYRWRFDRMRWAESNLPTDPTLRPRRRVDPRQVALPSFDRENAL